MRQRARVDDNHPAIVDALEALGWLVWSTAALGNGFPDLVVAKAGRLLLLEVKDGSKSPSRRKLTADEQEAHGKFKAYGVDIVVVEKVEDLERLAHL